MICLVVIDESHVSLYRRSVACTRGDRARKETLVELRIPTAFGPG